MLRFAVLFVLLVAIPAGAEDRKVTITFFGGARKVPLDGLKITSRSSTGDWTVDRKKTLTDGKTDKDGSVAFTLADG
jgi:hypothetical protein